MDARNYFREIKKHCTLKKNIFPEHSNLQGKKICSLNTVTYKEKNMFPEPLNLQGKKYIPWTQ